LAELVPNEQDTAGRAALLMEQADLAGLIVTRGAAGAVAFAADGAVHAPPAPAAARVVDTVGAGDAFSSVVILGLARGWAWPDILARAQDFAAAVVGLRGATTRDREFYEPFKANWEHP
jgi:fructokinase